MVICHLPNDENQNDIMKDLGVSDLRKSQIYWEAMRKISADNSI